MSTLAAPAGNPAALNRDIDALARTERALGEAADLLQRVAISSDSAAIDALKSDITRGRDGLASAESRYTGAVAALRDYAVDLHDFHDTASRAIDAEHEALVQRSYAAHAVEHAEEQLRYAALNPDDVATREAWERELQFARRQLSDAESAAAEARARHGVAADMLDGAARRAIARLQAATCASADDYLDHLGNVLSKVGEVVGGITEWAEAFFSAVIVAVANVVKGIAIATLAVLAVISLISLIALVASVALPALMTLLAAAIGVVVQIVSALALAGFAAFATAQVLGLSDLATLRLVVLALGIVAPPLGAYVLWRLAAEVRRGAEWRRLRLEGDLVHRVDPDAVAQGRARDAIDRLVDAEARVDSADDFIRRAGSVDAAGNQGRDGQPDRSVIEITRVEADGETRWIVTLPSTTEWVLSRDGGAVSDSDADLALMLLGEHETPYEAAVLDAMEQAGVRSDEPVLVTGWSLGGIMAGHLAESRAGGYSYAGVVAAGSPIDHLDTHGLPVLQVKHQLDPVHLLDLLDKGAAEPGRTEIWDGARSGIGIEARTSPQIGIAHGSDLYASTLEEHLRHDPSIDDPFEDWFYGPGDAVEHQLFSVSELGGR